MFIKEDIDNDGYEETEIFYSCNGCNAPPRHVDIIKDNLIIFTAEGANLSLDPLKDKTGFFLENAWGHRAYGYTRIKFLKAQGGDYYPFSEQDVPPNEDKKL